MIECYGGSRPQVERSMNEDAFVIGRDPLPYAAVCDGAGNAQQAAHRVVRGGRGNDQRSPSSGGRSYDMDELDAAHGLAASGRHTKHVRGGQDSVIGEK